MLVLAANRETEGGAIETTSSNGSKDEVAQDVYKIPLLGDIPILGNLFKSTSFSRGETEVIILVTPTILNPKEYIPSQTPEMKEFVKENPFRG